MDLVLEKQFWNNRKGGLFQEELDLCAAYWISDSLDIEKEEAEFQQYSSKRAKWIKTCES